MEAGLAHTPAAKVLKQGFEFAKAAKSPDFRRNRSTKRKAPQEKPGLYSSFVSNLVHNNVYFKLLFKLLNFVFIFCFCFNLWFIISNRWWTQKPSTSFKGEKRTEKTKHFSGPTSAKENGKFVICVAISYNHFLSTIFITFTHLFNY